VDITRLSSKGQVIIPKLVRKSHHWEAGQELIVVDTGDGVLLKPKNAFPESSIDDVAGCLSSSSGVLLSALIRRSFMMIGLMSHFWEFYWKEMTAY